MALGNGSVATRSRTSNLVSELRGWVLLEGSIVGVGAYGVMTAFLYSKESRDSDTRGSGRMGSGNAHKTAETTGSRGGIRERRGTCKSLQEGVEERRTWCLSLSSRRPEKKISGARA